jgi:hypothetical protein
MNLLIGLRWFAVVEVILLIFYSLFFENTVALTILNVASAANAFLAGARVPYILRGRISPALLVGPLLFLISAILAISWNTIQSSDESALEHRFYLTGAFHAFLLGVPIMALISMAGGLWGRYRLRRSSRPEGTASPR